MDKLFPNVEYIALVLEVCISLGTLVGAFFTLNTFLIQRRINYTVKRVANIDKKKSIPINAIELRHTIRYYIQQVFKVDTYIGSDAKYQFLTTSKVIKDIMKSLNSFEYSLYCISGGPALGKSVALRYVFSRIAKRKPCFYFPMRAYSNLEELKREIENQTKLIPERYLKASKIPTPVAFFDGIDEAYSLISELRAKGKENGCEKNPIYDLFLSSKPLICELFAECGLVQPTVILSVRPEILDDGIRAFRESEKGNSRITVCELQKIGYRIVANDGLRIDTKHRDILRLYRSLRLLQKSEMKAERKRIKGKLLRHGDRFPPKESRKPCLEFLKNHLSANEDSLFRYPMFIRYTYVLYKNLIEEKKLGAIKDLPYGDDFYSSFEVLVNSIIKWEFHEYTNERAKDANGHDTEVYMQFKNALCASLQAIAKKFLENNSTENNDFKKRNSIKEIFDEYLPKSNIVNENIYIAHSLMVCDESGEIFDFVHPSFYEYFAAQYLYICDCKHDDNIICDGYEKRKYLPDDKDNGIFRQYFSFLCNDEILSQRIAYSFNLGERLFPIHIKNIFENDYVNVIDEPAMKIWKIFQYLPIIKNFKYRDFLFTADDICKLVEGKGKLDISSSGWDSLRFIINVTPYDRVECLEIRGLSLNDFETISTFLSLKKLNLMYSKTSIEKWLPLVESLSLEWLAVSAKSDLVIEALYTKIIETQFAQKIWVWTDAYSPVLIKIYEMNTHEKELGNIAPFVVWRTPVEKAEEKFNNPKAEDITLMKAVFELEADEEGELGLSKNNPAATLWNGITLARCYEKENAGDVENKAYEIYERLAKHINNVSRNNRLRINFGYYYGKNLLLYVHGHHKSAKLWLDDAYENAAAQISKKFAFNCGSSLIKACIRVGDNETLEYAKKLIAELIELADEIGISRTNGDYMTLICYQIGYAIKLRGKTSHKKLLQYAQKYLKAGEEYADTHELNNNPDKKDKYYIFDAHYYLNVIFLFVKQYKKAYSSIEKMGYILEKMEYSCGERARYGMQMKFAEQKMVTLFLMNRLEAAKEVAEEYTLYPHRTEELSIDMAKYIIFKCNNNSDELNAHPEYEKQFISTIDGNRLWL